MLSFAASGASAIGLGTATLDSGLGEPLRFSLPVTVQPDEEIGCVQVRARSDTSASLRTRSSVIRSGAVSRVEVASAAPVNDPTVGVVVTVGCTSPIAREFVFFLDPPAAPVSASTASVARSVVEPAVPRGLSPSPPRRAEARSSGPFAERGPAAAPATSSRARRARARSAAATQSASASPRNRAVPAAPKAAPTPAAGTGRDRLSVVPTESQPVAAAPVVPSPTPQSSKPAPTPTAPTPSAPAAAAPVAGLAVPPVGQAPVVPAATPAPTVAAALPDPAAAAREEALRQQQAALQAQVKTLSDQIAALRVQTTGLVARNQALLDRREETSSPALLWLLAAIAAIATIVAAWMAWRYVRFRRSVEGSPWWSGNTVQATEAGGSMETRFNDSQLSALDQGTRMGARTTTASDVRPSSAPVILAPAPPPPERARPPARVQSYPPAIETDFTVSDIEAAMATVRTVAAPRKPGKRLDDTDFSPLGGPSLPSPFTQPPPAVPRTHSVIEREAFEPVQPMEIATPPPPAPARVPQPTLDFKLEIPTNFDPLSTDSHKRTEVDRIDPAGGVAFEAPRGHSTLDFELPSTTSIAPLARDDEPRHGATALDNLFATDTGKLGPDTILALDDGDGAPLSTTEVERLTTAPADPVDAPLPAQGRMARFADLMNEVDETAGSDALRAIAQLRQYVLRDENIPTLLWLKLFELYKAVDKKPVYDALAEHFARRYHRPMVGWDETLADRVPQTPLSAFQDLDTEIERSWGTQTGLERLQTLLCGRDQSDAVVFNAVLQRDLLDAAKIYLLDRDSSITASRT